ncbi:hypothetical protein SteCoe_3129 [Stentor coeruleus]|uniref:Uncharacterized protein n=1 Tax=Stentor coeruleus TaxID=5963 RepID=A0A1R2CXS2_9CILI|nr:hypothetical protein SteCoe_3129 [Stentor coeruleus]
MTSVDSWNAAPGSYNIINELGTKSQVYLNPPRHIMNKGEKNPSLFASNAQSKEWLGTCSPPSNKYSPNATLLFKSASAVKFGNEKRKDYFLTGRDRSPGPIYAFPALTTRTCSFGKGEKPNQKTPENILNQSPSPNSYNPKFKDTKIPMKMKGYSSEKVYLKNYEKYYKGRAGPGPVYSLHLEPINKGVVLPKAQRNFNYDTDTPGPGAYNSHHMELHKKSVGFGSKRNLDIRAYSNSYELFK